jgi:glycosidase
VIDKNPDGMIMPFLSNHDMDRIAGAFVTENNMRMAANLYLLSPGSPVIYYVEEIGMRGSRGGENTDANRRLAMLWGDGTPLMDPVGTTYPAKNQIGTTVADQMEDENSLLRYYCKLLTIRHTYPAIARGTYTALSTKEKTLGGFTIEYEGQTQILLHNTGTAALTYDLAELGVTKLCAFVGMDTASLDGTVLTVGPQTSVILE